MRIPIYTADLCDKRGLKRIAKKLQRSWPSATPLMLSSAQEILARGLGYRDLHDLQQSSENCDHHAPVPTQAEVRDGISTSIFAFCQSCKVIDIGEDDLFCLVAVLPLQALCVFRGLEDGNTPALTEGVALNTPDDVRKVRRKATHPPKNREVGKSESVVLNRKFTRSPLKLISDAELKSIWEMVQRRGNLRDQCLFSALLQGVRANELKGTKPRNIFRAGYNIHLRLHATKALGKEINLLLPSSFGALARKYIQKAGLSKDDYLFPSAADATRPMRSDEMNKIISFYQREALGDATRKSGHTLRLSVIANMMKADSPSLSELMKYISHTTHPYLAEWIKKSTE
ncbi:tyrosine-type recombinase/integrase [Pseudomonas sp. PLMAX]|uniref:tyrosine-type recombinase/integrase n=1 Tax=Pseudomonas sp. PLMAX TaxID=2201998 RepID=UPI0038BBF29B